MGSEQRHRVSEEEEEEEERGYKDDRSLLKGRSRHLMMVG